MKLLVAILLCWISVSAFSQKKYVPDDFIDISGDSGNFTIKNYYSKQVYASHVKVDDFVTSVHHGLMGFQKGDKYGLVNIYGKIIVPAIYDEYNRGEGSYQIEIHGDYFAVRKGDQTALLDSTGAFAIPLGTYDYMWDAEKGTCGAEHNGLFGLFRKGKAILPMQYLVGYEYLRFTHETMPVGNDSVSGLINAYGKFILPMEYSYIGEFQDTYWQIEKNGLNGLAAFNGKIVTPCSIEYIAEEQDGLIFGQINGKYGVQKLDGTIVCPYQYDFMTTKPVDGAVFARKDYLWGYVSLAHPEKTEYIYNNSLAPYWNRQGMAFMEKDGFWGVINTKNEVVVDFIYNLPRDYPEFSYERAFVSRNGLTGMISEKGEIIIPCEYEEIEQYGLFPKRVKKNGKYGLIGFDGIELIPCAYENLYTFNYNDDNYMVEQNGKKGIYVPGEGLLIPIKYDTIEMDQSTFFTELNNKIGLYDRTGKELLPASFNAIYHFNSNNALVNRDGILELYDLQTGKEKTLISDSAITFEKTAFLNFGKIAGDDYQLNDYTYQETLHDWYCINRETNALIGEPYTNLGLFNEQGNAVAQKGYYDEPIAITSKGEELKPDFHLVRGRVFDKFIYEDSQDSIIAVFQQHELLKNVAPAEQWNYIQANYHLTVEPQDYYNEWGEAVPAYYLDCYQKDSYFDYESPFPKKPIYEYTFYKFYSRIGEPNKAGWRWAIRKANDLDPDYPVDFENPGVVLISNEGQEIYKPNYYPVQSSWFHEAVYSQEVQWANLAMYPETLQAIRSNFPGAASLSDEDFLNRYEDSVYASSSSDYSYDYMDYETMKYTYLYYKTKNLQLFYAPPPAKVEYRFSLTDTKELKGGEALAQPDFRTELILDSKTANTFGNTRYFAYPVLETGNGSDGHVEVAEHLQNIESEEIKADLRKFDYYTKLIESGLATQEDYESEGPLQQLVADTYANSIRVYSYEASIGLALENELLLQPEYLAIALDSNRSGGILETNFIVVDSLFNVFQFNPKSRKLSKLKDARLCVSKIDGLITQSKSTKLYNVYTKGFRTDGIWRDMYLLGRTHPVKNVKRFYFVSNCSMYPLLNVYGEDSISIDVNGVESYVYNNYCDTIVTGTYSRFPDAINYDWYEDVNGNIYRFDGQKDDVIRFTEYTMQNNIPINDGPLRLFMIRETPKGMELYNEAGKTIQLSFAEYEKLVTLKEGDNGFGGVFKKGKFIAYDTFLPFPEKHEVYIHYNGNYWLVGTKNKLELVLLEPTGDSSVKKRYEKTFLSYQDFLEKYFAETAGMNPVQVFMWEEYYEE